MAAGAGMAAAGGSTAGPAIETGAAGGLEESPPVKSAGMLSSISMDLRAAPGLEWARKAGATTLRGNVSSVVSLAWVGEEGRGVTQERIWPQEKTTLPLATPAVMAVAGRATFAAKPGRLGWPDQKNINGRIV
jgi:hypothetical protein